MAVRRRRMVEYQIRRRGVSDDRVLAAMERVPRHLFVPPTQRDAAYDDRPLPIGGGQTISQPFIVARMAELATVEPDDRVLEIGSGSGYAAAVLAELAAEVVTVEIRPELATMARNNLSRLGYANVTVLTGDIDSVEPDPPFDAILTAAAAPAIPPVLESLLADGGRLVMPVGGRLSQHLWTVERNGTELRRSRHEAVSFVPLV